MVKVSVIKTAENPRTLVLGSVNLLLALALVASLVMWNAERQANEELVDWYDSLLDYKNQETAFLAGRLSGVEGDVTRFSKDYRLLYYSYEGLKTDYKGLATRYVDLANTPPEVVYVEVPVPVELKLEATYEELSRAYEAIELGTYSHQFYVDNPFYQNAISGDTQVNVWWVGNYRLLKDLLMRAYGEPKEWQDIGLPYFDDDEDDDEEEPPVASGAEPDWGKGGNPNKGGKQN